LAKHVRFHPKIYPCATSTPPPPPPQPVATSWMTVNWSPTSLGRTATSGNISIPLPTHFPTITDSFSSSTGLPPIPLPNPQLVVNLSSYTPLQHPPHQSPLPLDASPPTALDTRTHHMVLRPSTLHHRQANTTTSTTESLLQEPKTFNQITTHVEWRQAML
jgi:hypothetical protein